jgi:hypothetical protein
MGLIAALGKQRLVTSPPIFDGSAGALKGGARPAHHCRRIAIIIVSLIAIADSDSYYAFVAPALFSLNALYLERETPPISPSN